MPLAVGVPQTHYSKEGQVKRTVQIACAVAFMQALTACTTIISYSSPVLPKARFDPEVGYIYGRLKLEKSSAETAKMGLVLRRGVETINLEFLFSGAVSVYAVEPGKYAVRQVMCTDGSLKKGTFFIPEEHILEFVVEPGKAYYIGDFLGRTADRSQRYSTHTKVDLYWGLESVQDNYEVTTTAVKRFFPALMDVEALNVVKVFPVDRQL